MKVVVVLMSALLLLALNARAQESSSDQKSTKSSSQSQDDIDQEITNKRLRAETGALTKWSFASTVVYDGAALTNPFSTARPQLNNGQAYADPTDLIWQVSGKYRISEHDNLNAGAMLQWTPSFTDNSGQVQKESVSLGTPYVAYSHVFESHGIQNVLSATMSFNTLPADLNNHLFGYLDLSHEMMAQIGKSHLSLGTYVDFEQIFYHYGADIGAGATQSQLTVDPTAEYALTDNVSLRTVARWLTYTMYVGHPDKGILANQTQSLGLGYSVTRNIYLYPNFQWMWSNMNWSQTTIGFQAYINI